MKLGSLALGIALLSIAAQGAAQETQPVLPATEAVEPPVSPEVPEVAVPAEVAAPAPVVIPMNTTVMIQLDAAVSSRSAARGDMFPISLAEPVRLGETEVIPAGITGEGQVVHSAGTGFGGRAGELIVAARYLMWGERRIPLRGMRISTAGRNNTAEALALGQLIPLGGFLVTGTSVDLPIGQIAVARFAEDVPVGDGAAAELEANKSAATTPLATDVAPVTEVTPTPPNSNEVLQGGTQ